MSEILDRVAKALDDATEEALRTHGRFDTRQMARFAVEALRDAPDALWDEFAADGVMWRDRGSKSVWERYIDLILKGAP